MVILVVIEPLKLPSKCENHASCDPAYVPAEASELVTITTHWDCDDDTVMNCAYESFAACKQCVADIENDTAPAIIKLRRVDEAGKTIYARSNG